MVFSSQENMTFALLCVIVLTACTQAEDGSLLKIEYPNVKILAEHNGSVTLRSGAGGSIRLKPGLHGTVYFDGDDLHEIIDIVRSLPPSWVEYEPWSFLGTFNGSSQVNVQIKAQDPEGSGLHYHVVAGDLPPGLQLAESTGTFQGRVRNEDAAYSFTVRATDSHGKFADAVFRLEVLYVNPCDAKPCRHSGVCRVSGYGYKCDCGTTYGGTNCELVCSSNALGVDASHKKIPDAQMSAYLSTGTYLAKNGRYNGAGWCGENDNAWLQIDLGHVYKVYKTLMTYVGRYDYVNGYHLYFSYDGTAFKLYKEHNATKVFTGGYATRQNSLLNPTSGRFVRFKSNGYYNGHHPCMKVEIYGCPV